jgi:hypothetical protein
MFGRRRFGDLVRMQLDLFAGDEASLLEEASEADAAWTKADAEQSEELYGDYQLVVDTIADRLYDLRETYASTLDGSVADEYRTAFNRGTRKRFPRYTSFLEDD